MPGWRSIPGRGMSGPVPCPTCDPIHLYRSVATLQRLDKRAAVNTFGLGNVRGLKSLEVNQYNLNH
jgi:hypothetical protein